jgi:hypothetical protein
LTVVTHLQQLLVLISWRWGGGCRRCQVTQRGRRCRALSDLLLALRDALQHGVVPVLRRHPVMLLVCALLKLLLLLLVVLRL